MKDEISNLSSKNKSIQGELAITKDNLSSANNTIRHLNDNINSLKSNKSTLHKIYITLLIILSGVLYDKCKRYDTLEANKTSEQVSVNNFEYQNKLLQNENDSLKKIYTEMSSLLSADGNKSLYIKSIEIRNEGEPYEQTIYSRNTTYLNAKLELFSFIEGHTDIFIKLYTPYGLSIGDSSPKGFSTKDNILIHKNQLNTVELIGWGNKEKGHWMAGKYRFEFYYDSKLIGYKDFTIK